MNSATGCVLQLGTASFVVTAYHVVAKYKERIDDGEVLNWQVGNLPAFDPLPRIAWSDVERDIALMRLLPEETTGIGPCFASVPNQWPPAAPKGGELVLVAGYPKVLQEIGPSGDIVGAGPYSALFRVTTTGEGYFNCHIEQRDLISFDGGPLPEPGTEMGG